MSRPRKKVFEADFDTKDDANARMAARVWFFRTIERLRPQVITTLNQQPFSEYKKIYTLIESEWEGINSEWLSYFVRAGQEDELGRAGFSWSLSFYQALHAWAKDHHLEFDWIIRQAVETLYHWRRWGESLGDDFTKRLWAETFVMRDDTTSLRYDLREFVFRASTNYFPTSMTFNRDRVKARITKQFKAELEKHLNGIEAHRQYVKENASTLDVKEPEKRENLERDIEWLVKFQVGGMSYNDILGKIPNPINSNKKFFEEVSVEKAIRRAAKLVGISVRKSKKDTDRA